MQTVLGLLLPGRPVTHPTRRHVLPLPDGDALAVYDTIPRGWRPGGRITLLVHGLTGSHASPQVQRVARALLACGPRVLRMDLRSAGPSVALARRPYHAGRSDDVRAVLEEIHRWSPASPLTLAGFSLGGNIALKLAGEAATRPVPGLERVAALAPPIDLERCEALMARPRCRLYENYFVRRLLDETRRRQRYFPDAPPVRLPPRLRMREFDELYTAPRCGFAGALDYYRRASSFRLVPRIALPTLILTARDDPFIAAEPFEELKLPGHVVLRVAPHGGHLGFLGWDGAGGFRWAERQLVDWILAPAGELTRPPHAARAPRSRE